MGRVRNMVINSEKEQGPTLVRMVRKNKEIEKQ